MVGFGKGGLMTKVIYNGRAFRRTKQVETCDGEVHRIQKSGRYVGKCKDMKNCPNKKEG